MSEEEGLDLMQRIIDEAKRRVYIDINAYRAIVINADGVRPPIDVKPNEA